MRRKAVRRKMVRRKICGEEEEEEFPWEDPEKEEPAASGDDAAIEGGYRVDGPFHAQVESRVEKMQKPVDLKKALRSHDKWKKKFIAAHPIECINSQ
eukprot:scaffold35917_cov129-Isochrysis_galbana.AAC.1